jgi:hypothetical protein
MRKVFTILLSFVSVVFSQYSIATPIYGCCYFQAKQDSIDILKGELDSLRLENHRQQTMDSLKALIQQERKLAKEKK